MGSNPTPSANLAYTSLFKLRFLSEAISCPTKRPLADQNRMAAPFGFPIKLCDGHVIETMAKQPAR